MTKAIFTCIDIHGRTYTIKLSISTPCCEVMRMCSVKYKVKIDDVIDENRCTRGEVRKPRVLTVHKKAETCLVDDRLEW